MNDFWKDPIYLTIIVLLSINLAVGVINRRPMPLPILSFFGRWLRCAFFSMVIAILIQSIVPNRPYLLLCACGILIYFLAETFLYWIQISLMNSSDLADCRRYVECDNAWRPEKTLIKLKNKIEARGLKKRASFKCSFEEFDLVYATLFESQDSTLRLTIAFVPYADIWRCAVSVSSISADGKILYTESSLIPFGLLYPPNYSVQRIPLLANPIALLNCHLERFKTQNFTPVPFSDSPIEFLNGQNFEIEKYNRSIGLLSKRDDPENDAYLTPQGKYLVWLDMIKLNYFPFLIS